MYNYKSNIRERNYSKIFIRLKSLSLHGGSINIRIILRQIHAEIFFFFFKYNLGFKNSYALTKKRRTSSISVISGILHDEKKLLHIPALYHSRFIMNARTWSGETGSRKSQPRIPLKERKRKVINWEGRKEGEGREVRVFFVDLECNPIKCLDFSIVE